MPLISRTRGQAAGHFNDKTDVTSGPSTFAIGTWIFLRLLGIVLLIAFLSLGTQIIGLVGHDGILPAAQYMDRAREVLGGGARFWQLPTLAWLSASDAFLRGLCVAGAILSALLAVGVAPAVMLVLIWLSYLSLMIVCRDFLSYQWDALLLETSLLAVFIAPWTVRHHWRDVHNPPRLGRALLLWLLFRLMFGSGAVKLASDDPTWRNLTALSFHFWTQPIPTPVAWYANQLMPWILKVATAGTLIVELVAPLFIIVPRRARTFACGSLIGLQALVALTGNYAFFNLLSAALCVLMLDDAVLARLIPARARPAGLGQHSGHQVAGSSVVRRWLLVTVAILTVPTSAFSFARSLGIDLPEGTLLSEIAAIQAPFRSVNTYGLFAVMTTARPEIVIEGSTDAVVWLAYEFKYKPTDVTRRPPWVAPHQPRLDWQMWFAALSRYEVEPWLQNFCLRLLQGTPDVLALLRRDPFDGRAPKYVRAVLYQYRFSSPAVRRQEGAWWTRELMGAYSPVLSLARRDGG